MRKTRVLVAKPGLDGHDRGAKTVAYLLRDAGMEVVYTGLHKTPAQIAAAAVQEDVDFIGLSILSGAHLWITEKLMAELAGRGAADIGVVVGGVIPVSDVERLKAMGVRAVFPGGSSFTDILRFFQEPPEAKSAAATGPHARGAPARKVGQAGRGKAGEGERE